MSDDLLMKITNRIKKLKPDTDYYNAIIKLTNEPPEEFELLPGFEGSIRNIFLELNKLDIVGFDGITVETLVTEDNEQRTTQRYRKRQSNEPAESSSSKQARLNENEHSNKLKKKVIDIIGISNPSIDIEAVEITMTPCDLTDDKLTYKVPCYICNAKLSVSVVIRKTGYIQYRVVNYANHIEHKHDEEGKRIKDNRVSI